MGEQTFTRLNLVNISEAYEMIKSTFQAQLKFKFKKHMNISITGSPGLGKSSIVHQVAAELGMYVIDLRLSAMEESAVLGVPYVLGGIMAFSTPQWWPDESDTRPFILFLDELWSASPMVQTAAYRLILDRTIQNGKRLPDNCFIIAAGNLKSDKTGARDPLPAAANRFGMHLEIDKTRSFKPFIEWAYKEEFDLRLLAFLEWSRESVYGKIGKETAYATPRTIEDVNTHLKTYKTDYLLNIAIASAVGSEWAHKFSGYRENFGKLPDYERVKAGDTKYTYEKPDTGDIGLDFAIAITSAQQFIDLFGNEETRNKPETKQQGERLMVIVNQLDTDIQVIFLRNLKRNIRALQASRVVEELDKIFMAITDRNRTSGMAA